jgi:site-specific recombinase XerD
VKRFILFHDKRHPADMGADDIRAFLTHLAVHGKAAASTQNGALNALVFLYRQVLKQPFPDLEGIERAKRPKRIPTVFTADEMQALLAQLSGTPRLMAGLLYGAGLRLMECVRLGVKDVDFAYQQITVRDGKGAQERVTMLPQMLQEPLQRHLAKVQLLHEEDLQEGYGDVHLRMRSSVRTLTQVNPGSGNMFFLPRNDRLIHVRESNAGIIFQRRSCNGR